MSEKVRVAVVGLGEFGLRHVEAYLNNPGCELVAVVGRDAARTEAVATRYGIDSWFTTTEEMLRAAAPAAVSIVTAGAYHLEPTEQVLGAGASVLLEKPVVLSVSDAERLRDAANRASGFVMPAHVLRFAAPYVELKRRVEAGRVGTVLAMAFRRHRSQDHDDRFPDVHPALMTAIHDIDLAIWFSGAEACEVSSWEARRENANQPGVVGITVRDSQGSVWSHQVSWLLPEGTANDDSVEILGTAGTLSLDRNMVLREVVTGPSSMEMDFASFRLESALAAEIEYFIDCVRSQRNPSVITLAEAIQGVVIAGQVAVEKSSSPRNGRQS